MDNDKRENKIESSHNGHRQRLKNRFLESGFASFSEHEVLELIFFYALPRRDTKPLAKNLLEKFGSIQAVFEATPYELMKIGKLSENSAILFSIMLQSYEVYISTKNVKQTLDNPSVVNRYLRQFYVNEKKECFYIICLDGRKRLINSHLISEGSISETHIYARNIVEEIIKSNAVNVILAHNHPIGTCEPSSQDIVATKSIITLLEAISVNVIDHIIISDDDYYSFAKNKLIRKI